MGRRSRRRRAAREQGSQRLKAGAAPRGERRDLPAGDDANDRRRVAVERPLAPWGTFPLSELAVLLAIVAAVVGWAVGGIAGTAAIVGALVLGALAGLELAFREHFAGYRSHTTLLAGLFSLIVLGVLFFTVPGAILGPALRVAAAAVVFAAAFYVFRRAFKRRSGGVGFR